MSAPSSDQKRKYKYKKLRRYVPEQSLDVVSDRGLDIFYPYTKMMFYQGDFLNARKINL